MPAKRWFIVGGAGFIGGHFVDHLLSDAATTRVTVFDNFSSGRRWHLAAVLDDPRLKVIDGEVVDDDALRSAIDGHDAVIHLASNPDIARALTEPDVDFVEGTLLTRCVLEAMRIAGVPRILYASGSGVYGDLGQLEAHEDYGPLIPASTYGASKLAGEALISAYAAMFGMTGCVFRFANVVGPRQTHGVGFDFARRLLADPTRLSILGDGLQSKSYIHVTDVIRAVLTAHERTSEPFASYNVATSDYITVREIADITVALLGLESVNYEFTGGSRGWKGDVPVVRLNSDRIRALGWQNRLDTRQALRAAGEAIVADARAGRLDST
jgi:UDP-glucose 4-epimerase